MATPGIMARVQPLPPRPWNAPRRRFRGKKKYFRKVLSEAEAFNLDTAPGAWWDNWHYHADLPGWGNRGWKYRVEHLRALAIVFRKVFHAQASMPIPFQTWVLLDVDNAGYDGVFIHSPNPNHAAFPWKPKDVIWEEAGTLHGVLTTLVPGLRLRVGRCSWLERDEGTPSVSTAYLMHSPDAGIPLE